MKVGDALFKNLVIEQSERVKGMIVNSTDFEDLAIGGVFVARKVIGMWRQTNMAPQIIEFEGIPADDQAVFVQFLTRDVDSRELLRARPSTRANLGKYLEAFANASIELAECLEVQE